MNHPIEEIILASGSPRRKELLQRIGIPFRVVKSECEEITTKKCTRDPNSRYSIQAWS